MGEALLSRLIMRGIYQSSEVIVSEPLSSRLDSLKQQYDVAVTTDNSEVFTQAKEVVFLAVKPQVFSAIAQELANIDILNTEHSPSDHVYFGRCTFKPVRSCICAIASYQSNAQHPSNRGSGNYRDLFGCIHQRSSTAK